VALLWTAEASRPITILLARESKGVKNLLEMRSPPRSLPLLFLVVFLGAGISLLAGEKKSVEFQGKVSGVDLTAKTITVRNGNKDFVFKIDIHRCNVVKDGYYPFMPGAQTPALRGARVGDSDPADARQRKPEKPCSAVCSRPLARGIIQWAVRQSAALVIRV
jgi:hypothetical protein